MTKLATKLAVLGAGSWGTAIAISLAKKSLQVVLWGRDKDLIAEAGQTRTNPRYLTGIPFPDSLTVTNDLEQAMSGVQVVVLAVPSSVMRLTVESIIPYLPENSMLVSLAKGLEFPSMLRMSQVIHQLGISHQRIAVLSGPNHAEEVIKDIPSATVIASSDKEAAKELQAIFMTSAFRVYSSVDIVGVELGGAIKNVIAIAAGISDGLGYGDNTKASLITRGLVELSRLGTELGGDPRTLSGLSGLGDLIVTCISRHSRNRFVGEKLGKGESLEHILAGMNMVAEGITTSQAIMKLSQVSGVEMPICKQVFEALYNNKKPIDCVSELMTRDPAAEL